MPKYYGDEPDDVVDLHDVKDQHVDNDMVDLDRIETPPPPATPTPKPSFKPLKDTSPMPFGKFRGIPMWDVSASYLHWFYTETTPFGTAGQAVFDYIERNLDALKQEYPDGIWKRR